MVGLHAVERSMTDSQGERKQCRATEQEEWSEYW